jgi:hypothetical protein
LVAVALIEKFFVAQSLLALMEQFLLALGRAGLGGGVRRQIAPRQIAPRWIGRRRTGRWRVSGERGRRV